MGVRLSRSVSSQSFPVASMSQVESFGLTLLILLYRYSLSSFFNRGMMLRE